MCQGKPSNPPNVDSKPTANEGPGKSSTES